jgi:quinol monooxygenase YgiN
MPLYGTARYKVKPESVEKCKQTIQEYLALLKQNEPGTLFYVVAQEKEDPTSFIHFGIYQDADAVDKHRNSPYVKHYADLLWAETLAPAIITDYVFLASNEG